MFFATIVTELFVIVPKRVGPSEPYIQARLLSSSRDRLPGSETSDWYGYFLVRVTSQLLSEPLQFCLKLKFHFCNREENSQWW